LAKYPSMRKELEPLLRIALSIQQPPDVKPSPAFKVKARVQLMEQIHAKRGVTKWSGVRYTGQMKPILYKRRFNMVAIIIAIVLAVSALGGGTVYASQGSLPGDTLYPVKLGTEQARLVLTPSDAAKVGLQLTFADSRLEEMAALVKKGKPEKINIAVNGYDGVIAMVIQRIEANGEGLDLADISEVVALATSEHLFVLDGVMDIVPEEAEEAIGKAKGVSIKGHGNALRALATENPERAMEINLAAVEGRLNKAKAEAEEDEFEEAENAIEESTELSGFGEEISEIARGLGKDITTVEQLVARATGHHLDVLALVYEKVPEQAKPAIERAMTVSVRGHERAVEALKEKGALGELPEEPPIPAGVPKRVKERIQQELANRMLIRAELQKQATDFNFEGGIRNETEIAPALKGDEEIEIDGAVKTSAEWYQEAIAYLEEAYSASEAGDYAEAKEKAELAKDIFDAVNNFTEQTIGFWNLQGKPEEGSPPADKGKPEGKGKPEEGSPPANDEVEEGE